MPQPECEKEKGEKACNHMTALREKRPRTEPCGPKMVCHQCGNVPYNSHLRVDMALEIIISFRSHDVVKMLTHSVFSKVHNNVSVNNVSVLILIKYFVKVVC